MLLTGFNIAHYLLDKGYLAPESLLDGTFTVHQTSSRNANYLVNRDQSGQDSLFVKQVQSWDQEKTETLRTEATCYWLANNDAEYAQLKTFLPRYVEFDPLNHILITGAVDGAISLHDFYLQQKTFPLVLAAQQAELLSAFHKTIAQAVQDGPSLRLFRRQQPVVFQWSASGFPTYGVQRSEAERQMVQLITQNGDYMQKLASVREQWQTTSLIHGDIKPANFLINGSGTSDRQTDSYDLRLIDWETADIGDPCWDAAAIFQSYLFYWVMYEPTTAQAAQGQYGFPLDQMQPSMRQFWQTYAALMDWNADEARTNLLKTVGFCALKLIHTCYESIQQAPAMTTHTARMLQLSLNMLRSPEEAIRSVLSIP